MRIAAPLLAFAIVATAVSAQAQSLAKRLNLREGWQIESSCKVKDGGGAISSAAYKPAGWLRATVPTTVLAAQVAAGMFKNPYFGMNLRNIPGANYPINKMFAEQPMPEDSPYACSWWYRTEFRIPARPGEKQIWLHFGGISYRANIWLNGKKIADAADAAGMWREFEFNVTKNVASGTNTLAVEVFAQKEDDLGITFVDWNPMPPDKDMGLWRPVYITTSGPVAVRHGFVSSELSPDLQTAKLTATAELTNSTDVSVTGTATFMIEPARNDLATVSRSAESHKPPLVVSVPVTLEAGEHKTVVADASQFPQLNLKDARLWWPYGMGPQHSYDATFKFNPNRIGDAACNGCPESDSEFVKLAIRSVTSELTPEGYRLLRVNGRPFLVRGGGWSSDMMLRQSPERLDAEFHYVRDMNLNTIRLEGKLETDEFFEKADQMGIMVMAGWCCCDHWEHWDKWKPEDYDIAAASLGDQIRRLRNHPSVLVWLNGSDNPPPPQVETRYLEVLKQYGWPNPVISSATARPTTVSGSSGVKMTGPYDFVPPNYWLLDKAKHGGAYGFNTETSPGPAIPTVQSIKKILPTEHLWPVDDWWNYHAGLGRFAQMDIYNQGLAERYGAPTSLEDYVIKSQAAAYDGQRAMFEAFTRNRYRSAATSGEEKGGGSSTALAGGPATGVIQWMLNNAWPSMIWHLYDYFLEPAGGYFGTKKANEPLHIMYSYDDGTVVLSNVLNADGQRDYKGLRVRARVLNFDMKEMFAREVAVDAPPDSVQNLFAIPEIADVSATYFIDLRVLDAAGTTLSRNFYWLSSKPDVLDWEKSKGHYTPQQQFADMTQLNSLPKVALKLSSRPVRNAAGEIEVTVQNPSPNLAFMVRLRATDGRGGDEILPVLWEDNYFSLLPGESRHVVATFAHVAGKSPMVQVEGWNVVPEVAR
jgi:exo-1,4-beta-D-glucosaminidase